MVDFAENHFFIFHRKEVIINRTQNDKFLCSNEKLPHLQNKYLYMGGGHVLLLWNSTPTFHLGKNQILFRNSIDISVFKDRVSPKLSGVTNSTKSPQRPILRLQSSKKVPISFSLQLRIHHVICVLSYRHFIRQWSQYSKQGGYLFVVVDGNCCVIFPQEEDRLTPNSHFSD